MPTVTDITFFDIPTIHPKPTSPNTWKVRLVLNYKRLNYTTRWLASTEIQPTCEALGIPPTGIKFGTKDEPHYTLPAIIDYTRSKTNPVIVSDSTPIIEYLEREYPSTGDREDVNGVNPVPLFPVGTRAFHALTEHFIANQVIYHIFYLSIMGLYNCKRPADQIDFRARMEKRFSKPLEEVEARGEAREQIWSQLEESLGKLDSFYKKNQLDDGHGTIEAKTAGLTIADLGNSQETKDKESVADRVWIMGRRESFSDLVICGVLIFFRGGISDEEWKRVTTLHDGRWGRLFKACERWMDVDSPTDM